MLNLREGAAFFTYEKAMKHFIFFLKNIEEIIAGIGLVITILAISFNVIMRYFFSMSQNWAEEITSMSFCWVVFVGAAAVYKRKMHIGIDVLLNTFPEKVRIIVDLNITGFLFLLNIFLVCLSLIFSISAWIKPTHVLKIPYTFVDLSATVGFFFMMLHAAFQFIDKLRLFKALNKKQET